MFEDKPLPIEAVGILQEIVTEIVSRNWAALVSKGHLGRLTIDEIKDELERYPGTFSILPEEAWEKVVTDGSIFRAQASEEWLVDIPMWINETGESDLTLTVIVSRSGNEYTAAISALHVL